MSEHRFILEPYKGINTRYRCPSCQQSNKTFSLYIDTETGEHLHTTVGRCNRESNCGHHYTPKQYFEDNGIKKTFQSSTRAKCKIVAPQPKPVSFIPVEIFKASLKGYEANNFVEFLIELFGVEITGELISRYFIASSKHWKGATVFWQIDTQGRVRTGKIMLYNPTTGKRVKNIEPAIYWVHKAIKQLEYELKQCLFGEHLLIDKIKPIAIVESEKTAVIASVYLPQFIWLAVGSLTNLTVEKCSILKGRTVTLFPDLNGFEKWSSKAKELSHLATFTVSDLLERKATEEEKKEGLDLADYLIRFDHKEFRQAENLTKPDNEKLTKSNFLDPIISESWEDDIIELENYFAKAEPSTQLLKLNQCSTAINIPLFIKSHLATVKANNGKPTFLPYLNRLKELKQTLTANVI